MNCPHCQKALPENYSASFCPHCGGEVQQPNPVTPDTPPLAPFKLNWWIFFSALLAPTLLTLLSAGLFKAQANEQVSPMIGLFGGASAGIAFGVMVSLRIGKLVAARAVLRHLVYLIHAAVWYQ